jgi:hypothetical protein
MNWKCEQCGTIHTQNPVRCRKCGHDILSPLSPDELERETEGIETPEAMDSSEINTYSSTESELPSSPDVAPDGSIRREAEDGTEADSGALSRFLSWCRGLF